MLLSVRSGLCKLAAWQVDRAVWSVMGLLCSLSAHAFVLADLTVSSSQYTVFHAVLPFSQALPGSSREIQVQTGSPSDYERWGLHRAEALKFIRPRVVLTGDDAGYIELVSADPVAEQTFDLLLWVSDAKQKMPVHYKVTVADKSSVSKGEVLLVPLSALPAALPTPNKPLPNKSVLVAASHAGAVNARNAAASIVQTSDQSAVASTVLASASANEISPIDTDILTLSPLAVERNASADVMSDGLKSRTSAPFVTVLVPHLSLSKNELMAWMALVCSALLLLGFLLGRQSWVRRQDAANTELCSQSPDLDAPMRSTGPANEAFPHVFASESKVDEPMHPTPTRPTLVVDSARKTRASQPRTVAENRINLAKIYLSMGDAATAKSVLDEVIAEGSEPETTQALKLIKEMA